LADLFREYTRLAFNCGRAILRLPFPPIGGQLSIQTEPESLEQIRARIRAMSDLELRKYGRAGRDLADPKKKFGPPNPSFQIELDGAGFGVRPSGVWDAKCVRVGHSTAL
jgi:hypothetical protein